MNILIIEDDPVIGRAAQQGLGEAGHGCDWLKDSSSGLAAALSQKHDVIVLDLLTRRVTSSGVDIELTPTEFSILELLMRHTGQVVTRKMLCESLWASDWEGTTNVIEVHINRLRTKLQRGSKEPLIHTIRGRGYVLRSP